MNPIEKALRKLGPSRSSKVVEYLKKTEGISDVAARQRLTGTRIKRPVVRFPISLFPNREAFLHLYDQRNDEIFYTNLLAGLRETKSVYGAALDGIINRGGRVRVSEFPVISGAPIAMKRQVTADIVAKQLQAAGLIRERSYDGVDYYVLTHHALSSLDLDATIQGRITVEGILLEALRDWARKTGLVSYNKVVIRGDEEKRQVGPFVWDLTGPSYLLHLRGKGNKPGFFVADVFAHGTLDENAILYFIKKVQLLKSALPDTNVFAMLVADSFTAEAYTLGHGAGISLATISTLFTKKVAIAIHSLLSTLRNAAAIAVAKPEALVKILNDLSGIEGAASNLRGVLFELIAAYLAKIAASSVDFGKAVMDPETKKWADIDVLQIKDKVECTAIECKGKEPGGRLSLAEVEVWLKKVKTMRGYLASQDRFREGKIRFEIWTTGTIDDDALELLEAEKAKRTKSPIDWKDGKAVYALATTAKEKAIADALNQHYLRHPLAKYADNLDYAAFPEAEVELFGSEDELPY